MMVWSANLGRERTKLGAWMDRKGITQGELGKMSGVSKTTITNLCGNSSYKPTGLIKRTIVEALKRNNHNVDEYDFW